MKVFLLCLILIIFFNASSQTIVTLSYPGNFPKEKKVKVTTGDTVIVKVMNVNRKIFKVETSDTQTDFNVTVPELLKSLKFPSFLNLSLPDAVGPDGLALADTAAAANENISTLKTRIEELFENIERSGKKLEASILLYNNLQKVFKDCNLTTNDIKGQLKSQTHSYLQLADPLANFDSSQLLRHLEDTLRSLRPQAEQNFRDLQNALASYIPLVKASQSDVLKMMQKVRKEAQDVITSRRSSFSERQEAKQADSILQIQINRTKADQETFKETEAGIKEQLEKAQETLDLMYEFEKDDKINTILSLYAVMNNNRNFEFESDILVAKKDEVRYKIAIVPEELNSCGGINKKTSEVIIRTKGGLKIDFSTGLFLMGGSEEFLGKTYYWENIDATTRKIVAAERGTRLQLGIGAMVHFYKRTYKMVKPAFSAGASTTANFDDLNFHIGPSLIVGDKDRIIISTGLALKSAKVLDRQLKTDHAYNKEESPDDIPTVSQFPKAGWFIGVTYNISRFKSE